MNHIIENFDIINVINFSNSFDWLVPSNPKLVQNHDEDYSEYIILKCLGYLTNTH